MTSAEVRTVLDRYRDAWQRQDVAAVPALYTEDCEVHSPIFHTLHGHKAVATAYQDLFQAFGEPAVRVDDTVVELDSGPRAVAVWTVTARHRGEIFGMPASGKQIEITIVYRLTFRDGRIAREIRMYDFAKMLLQLGVLRAKTA